MKIALSTKGSTIEDYIDERFGRTPSFIIYDLANDTYNIIDNSQVHNSPQGAGIQTAQHVVNADVEAVITGHVGPKAFKVLKAAEIKVYLAHGLKVKEAITSFKEGKLALAENNDVEEHWV